MVRPRHLSPIPFLHVRHPPARLHLVWGELPGADLMLDRDAEELFFRELQIIEKQIEARRPLAVILPHQALALLARHPMVADVYVGKMVRPSHAPLDEFQIVAHALEEAFDLLVIVLRRNALDFLAFPAELPLDDFNVFFSIPLDVAAEANRAALDAHQLLARRIDERI